MSVCVVVSSVCSSPSCFVRFPPNKSFRWTFLTPESRSVYHHGDALLLWLIVYLCCLGDAAISPQVQASSGPPPHRHGNKVRARFRRLRWLVEDLTVVMYGGEMCRWCMWRSHRIDADTSCWSFISLLMLNLLIVFVSCFYWLPAKVVHMSGFNLAQLL